MIRIGADKASHMRTAMAKFILTILMLYAGFGVLPLEAGSVRRNRWFGMSTPITDRDRPVSPMSASRFRCGAPILRSQAASRLDFVEATSLRFLHSGYVLEAWPRLTAILRKQYDKTYVAVAFNNNGRAVTLNFIVVNGPDGWVIADVESPHDSLRMFLTQHRN
jgi:hypothetical protein